MSLDVMNFLRDEFLHKYKMLRDSRYSIDAPLRKIFGEYEVLLNGIDIASLQGAHKDLLYDLNCAVDDCLVESADQSLHSMAKRSFRRCKQRGSSEENRKKLEEKFPKLKDIISSHCGSSVSAPHKPASIPLVNYVVHGFQNQFDEIVKKISISSEEGSSQPNMRAVGIVGIGGSGKTTLASMVFNSREVREKYQIMIWASLTSTLNKKESTRGSVFREILGGAQNNNNLKTMLQKVEGGLKMADHTLDKHIEHFKVTLKRNSGKYLIVMDDVWETEYWFAEKEEGSEGKCILSREWIEKTGGTVVVTSRLEEMAENIVGKKNLYMMLPVEKEPCFEIFLDRATKDGHFSREDEQLRKLKKDIEDRCYGFPLAACTVADIIVAKRKEEEAKKEMDAAKAKAEAEAEAEASASKAEAGGEADGSKVKAETEGEAGGSKAEEEGEAGGSKAEAEAEGDTAAAKMEGAAALKAESEREEGKTEAAGDSKAEGEDDALEAKIEGKGKAEADVLKAETEGDVSKALSGGDTGEGTHGELDARLEKEQK
ncbi:unnamed protein product [Rhodiola kirilowii]